ncbi:MAG: SRPBCC family protein [Bacteroidota bacterium]
METLIITLAIIIVILVVLSFLLPENWSVKRSIEVQSTPEKLYDLTVELKDWEKWSPWHGLDPNTKWVYSDNTYGEGAWYTWESKKRNVGNGKLTTVLAKPYEKSSFLLEFQGMKASTASFTFEPITANNVKVTWSLEGKNKGLSKLMSLLMGAFVGKDFEKGLANIKRVAESGK